MALQKSQNTRFGITATYHKVCCVVFNCVDDRAEIIINGWSDDLGRQAEMEPIRSDSVIITSSDIPFTGRMITLSEIYSHLKTLEDWEGATDV